MKGTNCLRKMYGSRAARKLLMSPLSSFITGCVLPSLWISVNSSQNLPRILMNPSSCTSIIIGASYFFILFTDLVLMTIAGESARWNWMFTKGIWMCSAVVYPVALAIPFLQPHKRYKDNLTSTARCFRLEVDWWIDHSPFVVHLNITWAFLSLHYVPLNTTHIILKEQKIRNLDRRLKTI